LTVAVDARAFADSMQTMLETFNRPGLVSEEFLADQLGGVVEASVVVLGVDSVGLMVVDASNRPRVVGVVDDLARALERAQVELGLGPGIDTLNADRTVAVADLSDAPRYARLWAHVETSGVRAILSSPVRVGSVAVGNLNSMVRRPHAWTAQEIRANDAYASIVGVLLRTGAQARQSVSMAAELRARFDQFSPHLWAAEGPSSASGER
jgi:hypothetical protein